MVSRQVKDALGKFSGRLTDVLSIKRRALGVACLIISLMIFSFGFWVDLAMISLLSLYGLVLIVSPS